MRTYYDWIVALSMLAVVIYLMYSTGVYVREHDVLASWRLISYVLLFSFILGSVYGMYLAVFEHAPLLAFFIYFFVVLGAFGVGEGVFIHLWFHFLVTFAYYVGFVFVALFLGSYLEELK